MKPTEANRPLPIQSPADPSGSGGLVPLLSEVLARAWSPVAEAEAEPGEAVPPPLRSRLMARVQASVAAESAMHTRRVRQQPLLSLGSGVTARLLYGHAPSVALRPGEPLRARVIDLAAGARWTPEASARAWHREFLVLDGAVCFGDDALALRDYVVLPAGSIAPAIVSTDGARLFVRESALEARAGERPLVVRDAQAGWPVFAPGIGRRVLWQRDGQAALLYHAQAGARVPQHAHRHDEECLMVQGDLFLDDVLLQAGDYQLAPAGTGHRLTHTDTGVVIYAHGDLELQVTA